MTEYLLIYGYGKIALIMHYKCQANVIKYILTVVMSFSTILSCENPQHKTKKRKVSFSLTLKIN